MKDSSQTFWVALSFAAVGLTVGLMLTSISGGAANIPSLGNDEVVVNVPNIEVVSSVSADDDPFVGAADAPVTIVEFSDYQCPYCSRFVVETLPGLKEKYVDTGLVKFVYRDFPLSSHQGAHVAAEAAECVHEESGNEAYFEMHDAIFANIARLSVAEGLTDYLVDLASTTTGTDIRTCLESGEMAAEVDADFAAGRGYGVSGTPTFFINGKKLVGAYPIEVISQLIDEEL